MPAITPETLVEYFRDALSDAFVREQVSVRPAAEFYVVRLLSRQAVADAHPGDPLCDTFIQAMAETSTVRDELFRRVGDRALLIAGLWWEFDYRRRRVPRASSVMELGRIAYWTIGDEPFEELAAKFEGVVNAVARLGTDASLTSHRDLLRLYDLWQETQSPQAARALAHHGLIPRPLPANTPF